MEIQFDAIIVSCFGRGQWLALNLVSRGLKVALVDVSNQMGRWLPEDLEGPFGYYLLKNLEADQRYRLQEECFEEESTEGWAIWTRKGPIETRGPMANFYLKQNTFSDAIKTYLSDEYISPFAYRQLWSKLQKEPFEKNWIAQFAHNLASPVFFPSYQAMNWGQPSNLFAPSFIRRPSFEGFERSLDLCRKAGIFVFSKATIIDLDIFQNDFKGLEMLSEWSGILRGNHLVWMLSSEESSRFVSEVNKQLFPQGSINAQWAWVRFRLCWEKSTESDALPLRFVMIDDLFIPWTHSNFLVVLRCLDPNLGDVWLKIPMEQRFQRSYLENIRDEILTKWRTRMPSLQVDCSSMPQDYIYEYKELGPPRFPIYSLERLENLKTATTDNIYFDGPEHWLSLDWNGQLLQQKNISQKLYASFIAQKELLNKKIAKNQEDITVQQEGVPW